MRTITSDETAAAPATTVGGRLAQDGPMQDEQRMLSDAAADIAPDELDVTVMTTMAAAEPHWRRLEASAVMTPYQRFDWLAPLLATGDHGGRLLLALIHNGPVPVALLPLLVRQRFGLATATLLGAEMGCIGWMPATAAAVPALSAAVLRRLLAAVARKAGPLDLVALHSLPRQWAGTDNPLLAFPHQPAPDHFYAGRLADGPSNKRLRNILRGRRRLEESFGPVSLRQATTPAEIAAVHETFLAQRQRRFAEQGIANVFARDRVVAFFRAAAEQGLGSDRPALRLHALYAGDDIVATSCGSYCGSHYGQYINSTTDGPAAKSSLMGLLMHELGAELTAAGITSIDMGLGDFEYKNDWTAPETVYDCFIPLSPRGRLAASVLRRMRALKRTIKQNPTLFGLHKRLRAMLHRDRPG